MKDSLVKVPLSYLKKLMKAEVKLQLFNTPRFDRWEIFEQRAAEIDGLTARQLNHDEV